MVVGAAALDVARHFIQRWNAIKVCSDNSTSFWIASSIHNMKQMCVSTSLKHMKTSSLKKLQQAWHDICFLNINIY
jgi:hypothetical protein